MIEWGFSCCNCGKSGKVPGFDLLPSAPSALRFSATDNSVAFSWNASTDTTGVTGYDIYLGAAYLASTGGTTPTYTATWLNPATSYSFNVRAKDATGNVSAAAPAEPWQQADLTATTGYRYLRYLGPDGGYGNVAEVEFYTSSSPSGFSGTYKITARHSGKALDVSGGPGTTAEGANVHQWGDGAHGKRQFSREVCRPVSGVLPNHKELARRSALCDLV